MTVVTAEDILTHHGVKGMKWGVRKDDKLSSERVGSESEQALALIAVGAIYALAALGMHKAKTNDSGVKIAKTNANVRWKENDSLMGKKSIDELYNNVVTPINKDYPGRGTKMNCRRCTFAYEMRRRGIDVKATKSKFATGQDTVGLHEVTVGQFVGKNQSIWGHNQISSPLAMSTSSASQKSKAIFDALGKEPDGSRGELAVGWVIGGGHSMAYEIVNKKPIVFDTQSSIVYQDAHSFTKFGQIVTDAAYTRLDNINLNDDYLRRWAVNND
jgi:hypothetical protein